MKEQEVKEVPIEISPSDISEHALKCIIENFILREGTDYGREEVAYEKKADQIRKQLDRGDIKMIFDQSTETVSFITKRDFEKHLK